MVPCRASYPYKEKIRHAGKTTVKKTRKKKAQELLTKCNSYGKLYIEVHLDDHCFMKTVIVYGVLKVQKRPKRRTVFGLGLATENKLKLRTIFSQQTFLKNRKLSQRQFFCNFFFSEICFAWQFWKGSRQALRVLSLKMYLIWQLNLYSPGLSEC